MTVFVLQSATGLKAEDATTEEREIGVVDVDVDDGDGEVPDMCAELLVTDETCKI